MFTNKIENRNLCFFVQIPENWMSTSFCFDIRIREEKNILNCKNTRETVLKDFFLLVISCCCFYILENRSRAPQKVVMEILKNDI